MVAEGYRPEECHVAPGAGLLGVIDQGGNPESRIEGGLIYLLYCNNCIILYRFT